MFIPSALVAFALFASAVANAAPLNPATQDLSARQIDRSGPATSDSAEPDWGGAKGGPYIRDIQRGGGENDGDGGAETQWGGAKGGPYIRDIERGDGDSVGDGDGRAEAQWGGAKGGPYIRDIQRGSGEDGGDGGAEPQWGGAKGGPYI